MKDNIDLKTRVTAANIRKIRAQKNYTQDYLAAKLSISQNAYSKIELGYSKLTLNRLFEIASILEVDAVQLINLDNEDLAHEVAAASAVHNNH
jgi:transcriptional regulator with XRE-family HTH domain